MRATSTIALRTGSQMPVIGLGSWRLDHDTTQTIEAAIKLGYRMFDTSSSYGTLSAVGLGIQNGDIDREQLYLITHINGSDESGYEATRQILEELQQDYIDLLLIRQPSDSDANIELWEDVIHARSDALTRDIGVSNYSIEQIQELIDATGETPAVNQIEWTPFGHSQEMLEFCQQEKIILQAYSPLTHNSRLDDPTIIDLAVMYQKTPAQILLRWCMQLGVVPLPKANTLAHLQENLGAFDFELSQDDMATLNGLNEEYSAHGILPYV